jgi:predicted transcriptional regulator YheO
VAVKAEVASDSDEAPRRIGFSPEQLPALFELLGRVANAAVTTIGADCEVVVHDLREPAHSVVAISGSLTGRQVGAPVPDPALMPGVVDAFTSDDLRRQARTPSGRDLLSSTAWIRHIDGHIVGAVCINIDQAELRRARDILDRRLVAADGPEDDPLTTFATDISHFASLATRDAVGAANSTRRLTRPELVAIVRQLDRAGVFSLRGAARTVGQELGLSRASVYGYLREARAEAIGRSEPSPRTVRHRRPRSAAKDKRVHAGSNV